MKNKIKNDIFLTDFFENENDKSKSKKYHKQSQNNSNNLEQNNIILVGNPNTGKTTFFNSITNSNEHVGNWHGVTVDYKEKTTQIGKCKVKITDLPGLYSLSTYSFEEQVARDYIYNQNGLVINICDANNLARNLYLTLQLKEYGLKPIVCINMANELKKQGKIIDGEKLSQKLGLKVVLINAQNKKQAQSLINEIISKNIGETKFNETISYLNKIPFEKLDFLSDKTNYQKIKILEKDELFCKNLSNIEKQKLEKIYEEYDETFIAKLRYNYIDKIISECVKTTNQKTYGYSKLDKIVLNRFLSLPIFLAVVALIFFITFSSVGKWLTELIDFALKNYIKNPFLEFLKGSTSNQFLISFFEDAIFAGVGSLLSFLPQITLLFLCLSFLEDSGYLSRLAFSLEDYFSKIGLNGKSVFTLLMGFGCSTTSTMTARNLEDKNSKIKTAMLSPYLSCSAKIPIYTVICSAFFKHKFLVIFSLYLLSVVVAIMVSFVLEKTILKSGEQSFIMELPPYRLPSFKRMLKVLISNIKSFIFRVGSLIVSFSVIIWILQSCDFSFRFNPENSILKKIGEFFSPIFSPLGFGSYGAVACLICGIVAKEIIVGTMGIINNVASSSSSNMLISQSLVLSSSALCFNSCSALSFLVFSLLYSPCISTIGVMKKEIGKKWTIIAILIQLSIAYILSYITYKISLCFTVSGFIGGIISCLIFVAILVSFILFFRFVHSKNKCKFCPQKNYCLSSNNKKC